MNNIKKFETFLESLKGKGQDNLIESVKQGFKTCFEGYAHQPKTQGISSLFDVDQYDIEGMSQNEIEHAVAVGTGIMYNSEYMTVPSAGKKETDSRSNYYVHVSINRKFLEDFMKTNDVKEIEKNMQSQAYRDNGPGQAYTQVSVEIPNINEQDNSYGVWIKVTHGSDI